MKKWPTMCLKKFERSITFRLFSILKLSNLKTFVRNFSGWEKYHRYCILIKVFPVKGLWIDTHEVLTSFKQLLDLEMCMINTYLPYYFLFT